jgi:hypothetical protein
MNVIAYLNGETQITDRSDCVCVVVRPIAIWINDYRTHSERHILLPYIGRAMGSATRDRKELFRRAQRAARMAEEMRDIADVDLAAGTYAADAAKDAAEAASVARAAGAAKAFDYAAAASTYAAKASTYAAKASDYVADASTRAAEAADARTRIIDACLRFLDDCLPELQTVEHKPVERAKRLALAQ